MKILYVTEYFYPYVHGGGEVSTYQLAQKLYDTDNAFVLTPNYGAGKSETIDNVRIFRFPWPFKLKALYSQLSSVYFANPITWLYMTFQVVWYGRKLNADIIHAQSINSFPGVWLAARLLGKKCVINIRDNQILCNYGWCLTKSNGGKACSFKEYFQEDFIRYYQDKVTNKNVLSLMQNIFFALSGRARSRILKFFVNKADVRICGSRAQERTLDLNGVLARPIYNVFEFPKTLKAISPRNEVLYATKLSEGKGLSLLLCSWPLVLRSHPNLKLLVVGNGNRKLYVNMVEGLGISYSVSFKDMPSFKDIRKIRQSAILEVVPSIYPESFGRAAMEAIALGVPVVATNRGGLPEIVENNVTGYIVGNDKEQLSKAIIKGIRNNNKLRLNIRKNYENLKEKFEINPVKQHLMLYKSLV